MPQRRGSASAGAPAEEEHRTQESAAAAAEAWPASGRNKAAVRALQPTRYPVVRACCTHTHPPCTRSHAPAHASRLSASPRVPLQRLTRRLAASDRIRAATNALAIAANKSYKSVANLFRGRGAKGGAGGKGEGGLEEAKKEQDQASGNRSRESHWRLCLVAWRGGVVCGCRVGLSCWRSRSEGHSSGA